MASTWVEGPGTPIGRQCDAGKNWISRTSLLVVAVILPFALLNGCAGVVSASKSQSTPVVSFQITPPSISFGNVPVGKATSQSLSVSNTGNVAINITQATFSNAQFSLSGMTTPMALAVGQSGTFSISVTPTSAGAITGTLTVQGDGGSSPVVVNLSATGVVQQPRLSLSTNAVNFGNVSIGSTGSSSLTISNAGTADLTISLLTFTGTGFGDSGMTPPKTISAGQSAPLTLTFAPTSTGAASGSLTIASNDPTTPSAVVSLSGTGSSTALGQLSVNPASVSFGNVTVGTTNSQTIQLGNTGTTALTVSQVGVTGSGFGTTGLTLPLTLNAGQTSTFNTQFSPTSAGSATGSLTITSNAPGSPATVPLSGTGVAATFTLSFSSTSISFGSVNTGTSSTLTETITNTGNSTVQILQISVSGTGYSLSGAGTPVGLSAGQTLTFSIIFDPTVSGSATGTVTVTSNATGSPTTISLSGTDDPPHSVLLNWTESNPTGLSYYVYRSTTSGSGYAKLNASSPASAMTYTDTTVQNQTTYYYVTTAVDSTGTESVYSPEAQAIIP